jgi:hypothetical protein
LSVRDLRCSNLSSRTIRRNARRAKRFTGRANAGNESVVGTDQPPVDHPKRSRDRDRARARAAEREHRGGNGIHIGHRGKIVEGECSKVGGFSDFEGPYFVVKDEASRAPQRGEMQGARR